MKSLKPFLLLVGLVLIVGLACGTSTPTESQPPPAATQPPVAPPPQVATQPPVSGGQEYFTEEFDGDMSNWTQSVNLSGSEGDTSQANIYTEEGRLVFDLGKWLLTYVFYDPYVYTDVRIDARAENRGVNVNNIILVCRASDEGLYLVNIANSGLYAMYVLDVVNNNYVRMADGGSTKIKPGKEINDYALVCKEKTLTLYINGTETRRYTDNQYVLRKGQIGVGAASENQLPVKVEFEYVTISAP